MGMFLNVFVVIFPSFIKFDLFVLILLYLSLVARKPVFGISNEVWHKPGCATTQDGLRLEILYLGRGIVLSI